MSRDHKDERLDEEVAFHVDMQIEQNIRLGMSPDEARRQALITFGGRERWKSETREEYRVSRLDGIWKDVVFGRPLADAEVLSADLPDRLAEAYATATPVFRFLAELG